MSGIESNVQPNHGYQTLADIFNPEVCVTSTNFSSFELELPQTENIHTWEAYSPMRKHKDVELITQLEIKAAMEEYKRRANK